MKSAIKAALVILAAGSGTRFGQQTNKVWLDLAGQTIIARSLTNAANGFSNSRLVLVINPDDEVTAKHVVATELGQLKVEIIFGGATRHESEFNALQHLAPSINAGDIEVVLIHDGARPLAQPALFVEIAQAAQHCGGAIPTIVVNQREMDSERAENVARVQTPQGYVAAQLLDAYNKAAVDSFIGTDTAACMEKYYPKIMTTAVTGDIFNLKITYPQDLLTAAKVLERIGK